MNTRLPKSPLPLAEHALRITKEVTRLSHHFAKNPKHSHDGNAKRKMARLVHRRGLTLEALKACNPKLHEETILAIKKGGAA